MPLPYTAKDLVRLYKETNSGHFFDKNTMRFFGSRLTQHYVRTSDSVCYFITTEKRPGDDKRRATIRRARLWIGKIYIDTIGEFNSFETINQAKKALEKYTNPKQS